MPTEGDLETKRSIRAKVRIKVKARQGPGCIQPSELGLIQCCIAESQCYAMPPHGQTHAV